MTKKKDDASHVYRGYRKQILFILHKILTSDKNKVFQPEGIEDFSIKESDKVASIFQVKDYGHGLTVSDISSEKSNSFIKRLFQYEKDYPDAFISLAYFGSLGPELKKVSDNDPGTIKKVAEKITSKEKIPVEKLIHLFKKLQFIQLSEKELTNSIDDSISSSQLGIDIDNAKNVLYWWLFQQSEKRSELAYDDVIGRIQNIGNFLIERASHQEWLGSIISFNNLIIKDVDKQILKQNYLQGVSASFNHILKDLDIERLEKLSLIQDALRESQIVVLKGASGQGKTSLAYRYFYNQLPEELSYQIKEPEDRSHAYRIAEAIINHHKAYDMPLFLYYDVSITDSQWPYVLERFANIKNLFLLITIRTEDWQRNSIPLYEKIAFKEIELHFTSEEAEFLYNRIPQTKFLNFKDSWIDFGGKGPLLEYIYLLQNGETLEDRLKAQIERIKREANESKDNTELQLLRTIVQANSYGAKLNIDKFKLLNQLPSPEVILSKFHQEYLINFSEKNSMIEGFHPVRSQILCSLLFDRFNTWISSFPETLSTVVEDDLEGFLLYTFFDQESEIVNSVLNYLQAFTPYYWIGYKGIIRSLLWLGVKRYAERNRALVDELKTKHPSLDFRIALDIDIGSTTPDYQIGLQALFKKTAPKVIPLIEEFQSRQTNKSEVFTIVKKWMRDKGAIHQSRLSESEFLALAETAYWYGHLKVRTSIFDEISPILENQLTNIDIQIFSEIMFSFSELNCDNIIETIKKHEEIVFQQFSKTYGVLCLEETEEEVKVDYILEIDNGENHFLISEEDSNNAKSMSIIRILQKLYPQKEYYSTQGHGSDVVLEIANIPNNNRHDDTYKKIPKRNLPSPYLVYLNSTLIAYLQYNYRPLTWMEYIDQIISLRIIVLDCFRRIVQGLKKYYKTKNPADIVNRDTHPIMMSALKELDSIPLFPKCAVDVWGFTSEEISSVSGANNNDSDNSANILTGKITSLQKYDDYRKSLRDLFTHCSNFLNLMANFLLNRINNKNDENYVSLHNILDAYHQLKIFHKEFEFCFQPVLCNFENIKQLNKNELKNYSQLFSLWFFFSFMPDKKITNPIEFCNRYILTNSRANILNVIKKTFKNDDIRYSVFDGYWEEKKAIWIVGDILNISTILTGDVSGFANHFSGEYFNITWKICLEQFNSQQLIFLMKYHWDDICLCFTYKDKLLFKSIKKKDIISSLVNADSHFYDFKIEDTVLFHDLNLDGFWISEKIDLAQGLLENFINLKTIISHSLELLNVLDTSEAKINKDMINEYFIGQFNKAGASFQGIIDFLSEIHLTISDQLSEESLLVEGYLEIVNHYKLIFPDPNQETDGDFNCQISTEILPDWKKRIDDLYELYFTFYLLMVIDSIVEDEK